MEHLFLFIFAALCFLHSGIHGIGVNYGLLGNNLPSPKEVISLLKSKNIQKIRIFDPNTDVLKALEGSGIQVIVGVRNEDLQQLASDPNYATTWVNTNIAPHVEFVKFTHISAGNEVIPGPLSAYVLPAMQNLYTKLRNAGHSIPITTVVPLNVLGSSYPPSNGAFADIGVMKPIVEFLTSTQSPLLVNVYPYFAYTGDPTNIQLDYALLKNTAEVIVDNQFQYKSLFDAMVDAAYAALEKVGGSNVEIVVSETGWPSGGSTSATIENAQTYVNNLISHVSSGQGTPRRPSKVLETYIFALFNENLKPAGVEQNWGLYHPNKTEVYPVNFPS